MNYFLKIQELIDEFCKTSPSPDLESTYLESAEKINRLRLDALALADEGVKGDDERIISIYDEISKVLNG